MHLDKVTAYRTKAIDDKCASLPRRRTIHSSDMVEKAIRQPIKNRKTADDSKHVFMNLNIKVGLHSFKFH